MRGKLVFFSILITLLFILSSISVIAAESDSWEKYQRGDLATGLLTGASDGIWNYPLDAHSADVGTYGIQPLINDFAGDEYPEVITVEGNIIAFYEYNENGNILEFKDSLTLTGSVTTQPTIWYDDADEIERVAVVTPNFVYSIRYNISGDDFYIEKNLTNSNASLTGITCMYSEDDSTSYCVFIDNECYIHRYDMTAETNTSVSELNVAVGSQCEFRYLANNPVLITSIYGHGHNNIFYAGDFANDGNDDIISFDVEHNELQDAFDGDGFLSNANTAGRIYSIAGIVGGTLYSERSLFWGLITWKVASSGMTRLTISGWQGGANNPNMVMFDSDGSIYRDNDISGSNNYRPLGTIIYGNLINDASIEYCSFSYDVGVGNAHGLYCYDAINGTLMYSEQGTSLGVKRDNFTVAVVNINTSTTTFEIVAGGQVFDISDAADNAPAWQFTYKYNVTDDGIDNSFIALDDIDFDGSVDICSQCGNGLACYSSDFTNNPPNITNYFGRNFDSPVCTGTTVTYSAVQCGGTVANCDADGCTYEDADCTYSNDLGSDEERIVSNCGINNQSLTNGTWALGEPIIQCTFNNPTTYYVDLYLQDNANRNNYSIKQTVEVVVINGTAGIDCNFNVPPDVLRPPNAAAFGSRVDSEEYITENDLDEALSVLFQQSPFIQFLYVFICTLVLMVYMFKIGVKSPLLHVSAIWILWLIFALIGLMPYIWLITFSVVIGGLTSSFFMFGSNRE